MIKLEKKPKPRVLEENEETWTKEYQLLMDGDNTVPKAAKFRYRHPDIKSTLKEEAFDKCIFCESKISHTFPGETDHIIPVSKMHASVVNWENLAYVCKECNRHKSDFYDENTPLINPFVDDPNDHLLFLGPIVLSRPNDPRGQVTRSLLQLSRAPLVERKKERLEKVKTLLDSLESFPEGDAKEFMREQALLEASSDKEYSATVKNFLAAVGL